MLALILAISLFAMLSRLGHLPSLGPGVRPQNNKDRPGFSRELRRQVPFSNSWRRCRAGPVCLAFQSKIEAARGACSVPL